MATKKDLSFLTKSKSSREEAAALERSKREAELEEMRRLRAESATAVNWDNGSAPITDLDDWRASMKNAAEEERRKKMEAAEGLHGYRGKEGVARRDRRGDTKVFRAWEGKACGVEGQEDVVVGREDSEVFDEPQQEEKEAEDEELDQIIAEPSVQLEEQIVQLSVHDEDNAPDTEEPIPVEEKEDIIIPQEEEQPQVPPTYSRIDVKFSFGLIVRSNSTTGTFDNENLMDNETLGKCMSSTAKILRNQMPSPPTIIEGMDYSTFPNAYYDPSLEPTVISIEEDFKNHGVLEKGNQRTLVKASFPVFLREEGLGEYSDGCLLKETKSTVFQALRAAVSGGSFLR